MPLGALTSMIKHELIPLPELIYPIEEWRLVERHFAPQFLPQAETIFAVANGYLGMRGAFEEGEPAYRHGTFVNGFHETWPIPYGERAFGFATTGKTIVNLPDGKIIRLYVDDEPFDLVSARILRFEHALDMRAGTRDRQGPLGNARRTAAPDRVATPGLVPREARRGDLVPGDRSQRACRARPGFGVRRSPCRAGGRRG